jgi:hypothetical protein
MRHLRLSGRGAAASLALRSSGVRSTATPALSVALAVVAVSIAQLTASASPLLAQKAPAPQSPAPASPPPVTAAPGIAAPSIAAPSNDSYNVTAPAALRDAPSSRVIGDLRAAANVEVIARDRGWTRVRIEGWVPDSVLTPADTTFRAGLSAADLRADPVSARGKMVMWKVEFLALQTADPLRHGLADDEPYILARGPNSENALLYLVVPPSLMGTARALQPLAKIIVTARVRDGRSDPVGIPILDIQTIRRTR